MPQRHLPNDRSHWSLSCMWRRRITWSGDWDFYISFRFHCSRMGWLTNCQVIVFWQVSYRRPTVRTRLSPNQFNMLVQEKIHLIFQFANGTAEDKSSTVWNGKGLTCILSYSEKRVYLKVGNLFRHHLWRSLYVQITLPPTHRRSTINVSPVILFWNGTEDSSWCSEYNCRKV